MPSIKTAHASFSGGMRFEAEAGSGHRLVMDTADVEEGGQNAGFSPMELPLVALAGCTGMDVVSILRKQRQDLTGYTVSVRGVRTDEHPKVFVQIEVEHSFTGRGLKREAIQRAVTLSETKYCSVSAMLGKSATITHTIHINEEGERGAGA